MEIFISLNYIKESERRKYRRCEIKKNGLKNETHR